MDQAKNLTNNSGSSSSSSSSSSSTSNGVHTTHRASDMIQDTIDVVDNFPRSSSSNNNDTSSPSTTTTTNNNNSSTTNNNTTSSSSLTQIDSTLNALGDQYPFSNDHRARPHSSTLASSSSMANKSSVGNDALLRNQLGTFQTPIPNYNHPYNPIHWNGVALRNPYPPFGQNRTATKTSQGKNTKNPRAQSYEDKMDKQRLEHILFSGDQSGPLNQV